MYGLLVHLFWTGNLRSEVESITARTNQLLRPIGQEKFALGDIKLDKTLRTVTFPITLNRVEGPMEYLLVTSHGKIHESIFRTETKPEELHIAMLLLGAMGAGSNSIAKPVEGPVSNPSKEIIQGDPIKVALKWTIEGKDIERPAEDLVLNNETHATLKSGNWVYNGSVIWQGKFIAKLEGSMVSLITDRTALINNIAEGHDNDQIWTVNTNTLPPAGAELQMIFRLAGRPQKN